MTSNPRRGGPASRLLITGGSSYLGEHLVPLALQHAARQEAEVIYTYYSRDPLALPQGERLDVRDEAAVRSLVRRFQPDAIIHTAGSNRGEDMAATIRKGAKNITAAAAEQKARLIHISTDVVFDGQQAPYREEDPPAPLHAYGRAKSDAEAIVGSYDDHVIVRTSLIYGLRLLDRGTEWVVNALKAGEPVTLFTNQIRNPVEANALSRACLELTGLDYVGRLHVAGAQPLSRAEFTLRMLDWWGVEARTGLGYGPCDPEKWPLDCTLDISRAQALLETHLPGVDEAILNAGGKAV